MKWKSNKTPEPGSTRYIRRFLWYPVEAINQKQWRWLCFATLYQQYALTMWVTLLFVDKPNTPVEYKIDSKPDVLE